MEEMGFLKHHANAQTSLGQTLRETERERKVFVPVTLLPAVKRRGEERKRLLPVVIAAAGDDRCRCR